MPKFGCKHSYKSRLAISRARYGQPSSGGGSCEPMKKPVLQYTLSGELVTSHPSVNEAARSLGVRYAASISDAANGLRHTAHGFKWQFQNHRTCDESSSYKCRSVAQYTLNMVLVREYASVTEAAEAMSVRKGAISGAISRNGTSAGYIWRYTDGR